MPVKGEGGQPYPAAEAQSKSTATGAGAAGHASQVDKVVVGAVDVAYRGLMAQSLALYDPVRSWQCTESRHCHRRPNHREGMVELTRVPSCGDSLAVHMR